MKYSGKFQTTKYNLNPAGKRRKRRKPGFNYLSGGNAGQSGFSRGRESEGTSIFDRGGMSSNPRGGFAQSMIQRSTNPIDFGGMGKGAWSQRTRTLGGAAALYGLYGLWKDTSNASTEDASKHARNLSLALVVLGGLTYFTAE